MATTTPNYGWTVPTSTDLVKDGATAIETLGDAIDASMNTALGTKKAGMVLLNTTSFSGVSSQSFNNVFNASYENYKIIINLTDNTSNMALLLRLRVSGTDNSGSNYNGGGYFTAANTGTVSGQNDNGGTSFAIGNSDASKTITMYNMEIFKPFIAAKTGLFCATTGQTNVYYGRHYAGTHNQDTSYDGFTITPNAGNITGKMSVYGFNF